MKYEFNLNYFSENEKNWIKVIEKVNFETTLNFNPENPEVASSDIQNNPRKIAYYELRNSPTPTDELFRIEEKLKIKNAVYSSSSVDRMSSKEILVKSLEDLLLFLHENAEKKIAKKEDDYYLYLVQMDAVKGMLEYALSTNDQETFEKCRDQGLPAQTILKEYSIPDGLVPKKDVFKTID